LEGRHLFEWLTKTRQEPGLLAVGIEPEAIKFAHVQYVSDGKPFASLWSRIESTQAEQGRSLQRMAKDYDGVARSNCTTLLEPADYQILLVETPNVPADELKAAIRWRIKDLIEYHVDDATVDVLEVPASPEAKGQAKAMYAVATPNEVVRTRIALFEEAKIPLRVIDIPEMAQRNVAALFESSERATAMLAFLPWGGLLTVSFQGELLLTRRLEVTSVQLSQREHGDHYRERVATEISRSLDNFERQRQSVAIGELLLAPLPQDEGLEPFLKSNLYIPVRSITLQEVMQFPEDREPTPEEQWEFFYLFGAALRVEEQAL
jgi:MSHA biogenesis protein MshI